MNTHNLHEFINRYEENIDLIYGDVHDELFKWQAMKVSGYNLRFLCRPF